MKVNITTKTIWMGIILCLLAISVVQIQAQNTRVLVCNERNSVSDVMKFPSQARDIKTRNGIESILEYKSFIGNDKGNYDLTITSDSDFDFEIFTKSRTRNSKWKTKGDGEAVFSDRGNYYINQQYFKSVGFYSNGYDIAVGIFPLERQANVKFTWYTSNCEKSTSDRSYSGCRIENGGGLFGATKKCVCNGVESAMSKCVPDSSGNKPKPGKKSSRCNVAEQRTPEGYKYYMCYCDGKLVPNSRCGIK